jgi:hypothetical protein
MFSRLAGKLCTLLDDLEVKCLVREPGARWTLATGARDVAARRLDSVRRLINTQIDRWPAFEQRIFDTAAVAGVTFTAGVVADALDADAA